MSAAQRKGQDALLAPDGSIDIAVCMAIADEADAYFALEREIKDDGSDDLVVSDGAGGYRRIPRHV